MWNIGLANLSEIKFSVRLTMTFVRSFFTCFASFYIWAINPDLAVSILNVHSFPSSFNLSVCSFVCVFKSLLLLFTYLSLSVLMSAVYSYLSCLSTYLFLSLYLKRTSLSLFLFTFSLCLCVCFSLSDSYWKKFITCSMVNERFCFVVKSDLSREKRKDEQTRLGISDLQTCENNE
jgi:hypothetical protein